MSPRFFNPWHWHMLPMDPDLPLLCIEDLELRRCKADENVRLRKECPLCPQEKSWLLDGGS